MSKSDILFQSFIDIDTATEISYATLAALSESSDNDNIKYIILGVMQQLEKIKEAADNIMDKTTSRKTVA